jgi:hypothetical protein
MSQSLRFLISCIRVAGHAGGKIVLEMFDVRSLLTLQNLVHPNADAGVRAAP